MLGSQVNGEQRVYVGLGYSENCFHVTRENIPCFFEDPHPFYWVVNGIDLQIILHKSEKEHVRFGDKRLGSSTSSAIIHEDTYESYTDR